MEIKYVNMNEGMKGVRLLLHQMKRVKSQDLHCMIHYPRKDDFCIHFYKPLNTQESSWVRLTSLNLTSMFVEEFIQSNAFLMVAHMELETCYGPTLSNLLHKQHSTIVVSVRQVTAAVVSCQATGGQNWSGKMLFWSYVTGFVLWLFRNWLRDIVTEEHLVPWN